MKKYQARAAVEGVDALGYYMAPPLQVLKVGKITGIPREVLRPDTYPLTSAHVSI